MPNLEVPRAERSQLTFFGTRPPERFSETDTNQKPFSAHTAAPAAPSDANAPRFRASYVG